MISVLQPKTLYGGRVYFVKNIYLSAEFTVFMIFIRMWSINFDKTLQQKVPAAYYQSSITGTTELCLWAEWYLIFELKT